MSIARGAIEKPLLTWLLMLGCLMGGIWGFLTLGRLEDPAFTIKSSVVVTGFPGATAHEVAREVSEPLESAIQQLSEVDFITSRNTAGLSIITVQIKPTIPGTALPQVWDKLRKRVEDARGRLPQGVGAPRVNDSFGDVFGIFYAVTAPGLSDAERHDLARHLRRELVTVDNVANVTIDGLPEEAIFVQPRMAQLYNLGVSPAVVGNALSQAGQVVPAGSVRDGSRRLPIEGPQTEDSVDDIAGLAIGVGGEVVNLADISDVYRDRVAYPEKIIRFNGQEAFTLGVAGVSSANIVDVGEAVDARLATLARTMPLGVELHPVYQQHVVVDESSDSFIVNLAMSVSIVVVVLALAMGWRSAVVVGVTLFLTVIGTLFFMKVFAIEMERISLGALIIAMGMLVDNAIVIAEGMQTQMARGRRAVEAAEITASKTQIPLLGATVIGIMAFAGIGLSPDSTGEFMFSLFAVIGISLLLSWVLAVTVTPMLAAKLYKVGAEQTGEPELRGALAFYARTLSAGLRLWWLVVPGLIAVTVLCYAGFGQIKQQFFPDSNTPLFFINYQLAEGDHIHAVSEDMARLEDWLLEQEGVVSVASFIGAGATRFMLTYAPEQTNPTYAQLIVRTENLEQIPPLRQATIALGAEQFPGAAFRTERLAFGPGGGLPIAVRFSGPDAHVLRRLADEAEAAMRGASDQLRNLQTDWRNAVRALKPVYATDRAQTAGVTRSDIASTLEFATDGIQGGTYQEGDRLIPIILRQSPEEAAQPGHLINQVVWSEPARRFVPLEQMIDGFESEVRDPIVMRRDRLPTITVLAAVPPGVNASAVFNEIRGAVEAVEMPDGYKMEWGGEYENSTDANESLGRQLPISILIMVLISILLFNALRQPLVIWLLVPMSVNGVVIGLLGTGFPFTFTALLGLLSLSGMLLKNGIVLVEEIDLRRADGDGFRDAIIRGSASRVAPILLASGTTILGMAPLLSDAFFRSMAVTIMGGLAFATVLSLLAAPVFYYLMFPKARRAG